MIKAGAFDGLGLPRKGLLERFEEITDAIATRRRNEEAGQFSLFGSVEPASENGNWDISDVEWSKDVKLGFEKEMLGLYVSDHPLLAVASSLKASGAVSIPTLLEMSDGASVTIGGLITAVNRKYTKKGDLMMFCQVEDLEGSIEAACFTRTVSEFGQLINEDAIVLMKGRLDHRGDDVKLIVKEVIQPRTVDIGTVRLKVPAHRMSADLVGRLKSVLGNHPGSAAVYLELQNGTGHKTLKLSDEFRVEPRSALYAELGELLGPNAVGV